MKYYKIILFVILGFFLFSCGSKRPLPKPEGEVEIPAYKNKNEPLREAAFPIETPAGIIFSYKDKYAKHISVVGDFNNWNPNISPMKKNKYHVWKTTIPLKKGNYSYKFAVDRQWILDPHNPNRVSNKLGDQRSVLVVKKGSDEYFKPVASGFLNSYPPITMRKGILFTYKNLKADYVAVAGDFNNWDKNKNPMAMNKNGIWSLVVPLEKGKHKYKFFVDNLWLADSNNNKKAYDRFGQEYSILTVTNNVEDEEEKPHIINRIPYKFKYQNKNLPSYATISVIGNFNNWDPKLTIMRDLDQDKIWEGIVYLKPGKYFYRFQIENEIFLDPYAKQKVAGDGQLASYVELFQPPNRYMVKFVYKNYKHTDIHHIYLVGDFNNWNYENEELEFDFENNYWYVIVDLPAGFYRYKYLVNHEWALDVSNPNIVIDDNNQPFSAINIP